MNRISKKTLGVLVLSLLFGSDNTPADHRRSDVGQADIANGKALYSKTCVVCHGNNGKGMVPGAPDFRGSDSRLVRKDIDTLLQNVDEGYQSSGSPMAMPPKGGSPNLSEQDLLDILSYMREEFGN